MGILSRLFGNKNVKNDMVVEIFSPIDGNIVELVKVPDEAFACGAIGDGVAIIPSEDGEVIQAPVDTDDMSIFDTNHAVSFESEDGLEIIVHFGVDTVQLGGRGFERIAEEGAAKTGDRVVRYDLDFLKKNAKSVITPVIISNMEMVESIEKASGKVRAGELLMKVRLK